MDSAGGVIGTLVPYPNLATLNRPPFFAFFFPLLIWFFKLADEGWVPKLGLLEMLGHSMTLTDASNHPKDDRAYVRNTESSSLPVREPRLPLHCCQRQRHM